MFLVSIPSQFLRVNHSNSAPSKSIPNPKLLISVPNLSLPPTPPSFYSAFSHHFVGSYSSPAVFLTLLISPPLCINCLLHFSVFTSLPSNLHQHQASQTSWQHEFRQAVPPDSGSSPCEVASSTRSPHSTHILSICQLKTLPI